MPSARSVLASRLPGIRNGESGLRATHISGLLVQLDPLIDTNRGVCYIAAHEQVGGPKLEVYRQPAYQKSSPPAKTESAQLTAFHMSVPRTSSNDLATGLLRGLLREPELGPRATLTVQRVAESLSHGAAILYLVETPESSWRVKARIGEVRLAAVVPFETGQLPILAKSREPLILTPKQLAPEDYAHLGLLRTPRSWAGLPILHDQVLVGVLEVVSFDDVISESDLAGLAECVEDVGPALSNALAYEQERAHYMEALSRLAALYDLEKVFSSTLEMNTLFNLVPSKFRDLLQVRAVNLWMVKDQEQLELVRRAGEDPSLPIGSVQQKGEDLVAQVSDSGEAKLISDRDDVYLKRRNAGLLDGKIFSLMAAPLVARGDLFRTGIGDGIRSPFLPFFPN